MLDAHPSANTVDNRQHFIEGRVIGSREEVMRGVDVESAKQEQRQKSSDPGISISCRSHSMFSEIFNSLCPLAPEVLHPVSTKENATQKQSEKTIYEEEELQRVEPVPAASIEVEEDECRHEIQEVRQLFFD